MYKGLVLDTHACVFALSAPGELGKDALSLLRDVEKGKRLAWIPAPVVAEIAILKEHGKIDLGVSDLAQAFDASSGLRFLALDLAQLKEFAAHRTVRDPFDRLILSAARATNCILVTKDRLLRELALVETAW